MGNRILSGFKTKEMFLSIYSPADRVRYGEPPVDPLQLLIYKMYKNCEGVVLHGQESFTDNVPVMFFNDYNSIYFIPYYCLEIVSR